MQIERQDARQELILDMKKGWSKTAPPLFNSFPENQGIARTGGYQGATTRYQSVLAVRFPL
jgi:hypothetical protein